MHTLLHKPAFIPKYFCNKLTKTPFGGHFLIIWLNGYFHDEVLKTLFVEKTGYVKNGEKNWRYNGDIFLLLDKNSFSTSHSKTFS